MWVFDFTEPALQDVNIMLRFLAMAVSGNPEMSPDINFCFECCVRKSNNFPGTQVGEHLTHSMTFPHMQERMSNTRSTRAAVRVTETRCPCLGTFVR